MFEKCKKHKIASISCTCETEMSAKYLAPRIQQRDTPILIFFSLLLVNTPVSKYLIYIKQVVFLPSGANSFCLAKQSLCLCKRSSDYYFYWFPINCQPCACIWIFLPNFEKQDRHHSHFAISFLYTLSFAVLYSQFSTSQEKLTVTAWSCFFLSRRIQHASH